MQYLGLLPCLATYDWSWLDHVTAVFKVEFLRRFRWLKVMSVTYGWLRLGWLRFFLRQNEWFDFSVQTS